NTGIAIVNPNPQPVVVSFNFTDLRRNDFGASSFVIDANRQISAFLNEVPFNAPANMKETFTFQSSLLISAMDVRGVVNTHNEFLIATLPVTDLSSPPTETQTVAHLAYDDDLSVGWTTEIELVNPTDDFITNALEAFDPTGLHVLTD